MDIDAAPGQKVGKGTLMMGSELPKVRDFVTE
jgi:hypothetical protein